MITPARIRIVTVVLALATAGLLVSQSSSGAGAPKGMRTIEVTIEHSLFIPDTLDVRPGETVRFVVTNNDPIDHEFLIGDESVQRAHEDGTEPHHGAKPGEISIAAGETEETTFRFGRAGYTLFGCHLPGHYGFGMKGVIVIS